jgi:hypothetical protein
VRFLEHRRFWRCSTVRQSCNGFGQSEPQGAA